MKEALQSMNVQFEQFDYDLLAKKIGSSQPSRISPSDLLILMNLEQFENNIISIPQGKTEHKFNYKPYTITQRPGSAQKPLQKSNSLIYKKNYLKILHEENVNELSTPIGIHFLSPQPKMVSTSFPKDLLLKNPDSMNDRNRNSIIKNLGNLFFSNDFKLSEREKKISFLNKDEVFENDLKNQENELEALNPQVQIESLINNKVVESNSVHQSEKGMKLQNSLSYQNKESILTFSQDIAKKRNLISRSKALRIGSNSKQFNSLTEIGCKIKSFKAEETNKNVLDNSQSSQWQEQLFGLNNDLNQRKSKENNTNNLVSNKDLFFGQNKNSSDIAASNLNSTKYTVFTNRFLDCNSTPDITRTAYKINSHNSSTYLFDSMKVLNPLTVKHNGFIAQTSHQGSPLRFSSPKYSTHPFHNRESASYKNYYPNEKELSYQ